LSSIIYCNLLLQGKAPARLHRCLISVRDRTDQTGFQERQLVACILMGSVKISLLGLW